MLYIAAKKRRAPIEAEASRFYSILKIWKSVNLSRRFEHYVASHIAAMKVTMNVSMSRALRRKFAN